MFLLRYSATTVIAAAMLTGCSALTPPAQMERITEGGTYWLNYSSDRRGAIVRTFGGHDGAGVVKVCAEPAPDTSNNLEIQGNATKPGVGDASAQVGQQAQVLPGRNSNVLSLRESLYRICELSINRPDITGSELMTAYNSVILAVAQYAEAEAARVDATTVAIIRAANPAPPDRTAFAAAKDAEHKGFEDIASGNFAAALTDFSNAEDLYPGYHNVFEIRNALRKALADGGIDDTEKQTLLRNIAGRWSWGAPGDVLSQIKSQIK